MKKSIYSTAFNLANTKGFNVEDALRNWAFYADEICITVNDAGTDDIVSACSFAVGVENKVKVIRTDLSTDDPFFYGKLENSALQACTSDVCIQQNLDERLGGSKEALENLCQRLMEMPFIAFFIPVVNLYGSYRHYIDWAAKWYIHKRAGTFRGPVHFGIKENGLPDYNKTSTDELIDENNTLVSYYPILSLLNLDEHAYASSGYPFVYHLGYVDLKERVKRNEFWKPFWEKATGGDSNTHELEVKHLKDRLVQTKQLNLPLWPKI